MGATDQWVSRDALHRLELAVAERSAAELRSLDERWHATVVDGGLPGAVSIETRFGNDEPGPIVRVGMDMLPELWASALTEVFTHPSRVRARAARG